MWINQIFSTSSRVYVRRKPLNKPWFWMGPKLDKKSAAVSGVSSAHSLLWIFSSLSTKWVGVEGRQEENGGQVAIANFLVAPHPEHDGVWLLGGGSGHGFKHGPALAEYVERLLNGEEKPDPAFGLGARDPGGGLRAPWIER